VKTRLGFLAYTDDDALKTDSESEQEGKRED
jgi:hypothetical protein